MPREAGSTLELREDMGYANTGQLTYLLAVDIEINGPWFLHSLSLSPPRLLNEFSRAKGVVSIAMLYRKMHPWNKTFSIPDATHFLRSLQRQC